MPTAIEVHGLVKRYGELTAVAGIDLVVAKGECFGLLGPNGAGKTTTVEILEGLLPPTSGDVSLLGMRWGEDDRKLRARIGVALQETQLTDKLTVEETLNLFRSFYKEGRAVNEVLGLVALEEKRGAWVSKLSGGQKQRLAVACALVGNPELLFLDEPSTGLDPQSRRQVWDIVNGFKQSGRTVLLTTHYMEEAEKLCDRVGIVDHGRVIALGTPAELIAQLGGNEVVEFSTSPALARTVIEALPGVCGLSEPAGLWRITVQSLRETLPALVGAVSAAGAHMTSLATHRASLEDVFVSLTGRKLRDS